MEDEGKYIPFLLWLKGPVLQIGKMSNLKETEKKKKKNEMTISKVRFWFKKKIFTPDVYCLYI